MIWFSQIFRGYDSKGNTSIKCSHEQKSHAAVQPSYASSETSFHSIRSRASRMQTDWHYR